MVYHDVMPNVHQISDQVFRFDLYNLNYFKTVDIGIDAHWTFWYHKKSGKIVLCKFGDYHNLVSIRLVKDSPRFPSLEQEPFVRELVMRTLKHSCFYNYSAPLDCGPYLLDELEENCVKRDGWGTEWFKHDYDEFFDQVMKRDYVFPVEYPDKDYKVDREYWSELKRRDKAAIKLLEPLDNSSRF